MKKITEGTAALYTALLILVTFIIRLFIAAYTGLGIGEAYYFRGALHLDLSYFDQPPLFFWLGGLSIKVFGLTNLGIRFPSVLLFAGTSWLLYLVTKKLFNAKSGFWAVLVMNLSAVFTIPIACWFQPDAPLMFFWLLSTYIIVDVLSITDEGRTKRSAGQVYLLWILVGICMGLATLSKYHVIFLFAGVFIFVSANKNQRHWLRHPGPYIAMLITLIIAFPVLYWNYKNNWVSFVFQGSRAGSSGGLHPVWFLRSVGGQCLWLLPWFWFPLVKQLIVSFKKRTLSQSYSFLFWTAILPLVFFTTVTLWSDLQYHFHWQAPGYLMLFMPLGYAIDKNISDPQKARGTRRWLIFSALFTVITIGVLCIHEVTGFWQSYGPKWVVSLVDKTPEAKKNEIDPTIQGVDYDDILTRFKKEGWMDNNKIFAGTTRWWLNGKVDWALKGNKDIVCFNDDPRNIAFLIDPNKLLGEDAVVIDQASPDNVDRDVKPFFDSVKQLPDIAIIRNGRDELHLHVYYCTKFHVPAKPLENLPLYHQLTGRPPFGK
jgi:hypothetical protein